MGKQYKLPFVPSRPISRNQYADLRKVFACTVTFNLIKTDSKRTENTHGPRTDEERMKNGS